MKEDALEGDRLKECYIDVRAESTRRIKEVRTTTFHRNDRVTIHCDENLEVGKETYGVSLLDVPVGAQDQIPMGPKGRIRTVQEPVVWIYPAYLTRRRLVSRAPG